jgi:hypothetical protein
MPRYRVSEIAQGGAEAIRAACEAEAGMLSVIWMIVNWFYPKREWGRK